jgi:2-keto-3-deoxy-L-rhamnonate aldolase RhmA
VTRLHNPLKDRLSAGQTIVGPLLSFNSPELVELFGHVGFDFVLIDAEHNLVSPETCQHLVRAAETAGIVPLVRVPRNEPTAILPYLETGALGVVVPHIASAEDAERAVSAVKYRPRGNRSAAGSSRPANYGLTQSAAEYFAAANARTLVIALVEEVAGFRNLEEIGRVDGLDLLFFGDGDLAMDMGYPGQRDHPQVRQVIDDARTRGLAAGFVLGAPAASASAVAEQVQSGFRLVLVPALALVAHASRQFLEFRGGTQP